MAVAVVVLLIAAADANGGTYLVRECHNSAPQNHSHQASAERLPDPGAYTVSAGSGVCGQAGNDFALRVFPENYALTNQFGRVSFKAPPGTEFSAVDVAGKLRTEEGHIANLEVTTSTGSPRIPFGSGGSGPTTWRQYSWDAGTGPGYEKFRAAVTSSPSAGPTASSPARPSNSPTRAPAPATRRR